MWCKHWIRVKSLHLSGFGYKTFVVLLNQTTWRQNKMLIQLLLDLVCLFLMKASKYQLICIFCWLFIKVETMFSIMIQYLWKMIFAVGFWIIYLLCSTSSEWQRHTQIRLYLVLKDVPLTHTLLWHSLSSVLYWCFFLLIFILATVRTVWLYRVRVECVLVLDFCSCRINGSSVVLVVFPED